ncbi:MAG: alpha-2-macroglobulin, partial [Candidatus Omnitrophica bacterium]|nr:alpha-2-macroglobulin [Candidatus Omnitrophota bacterium]
AVRYLQTELVESEDQPDMLAWMLHALATAKSTSKFEDKQIERLWDMRDKLNPYTRALFALSQHHRQDSPRALVLARNLANGMIEDKDNQTVHWGESGIYYRFSEGGVEATAFVIKALSNISPQSELIPSAVKWLAMNRRGARWQNTRDTAIAILGLADYLRTTNELNPDFTFTILVNGRTVREERVNRANLFTFERRIELPNEKLRDGKNLVEVRVNGAGSLYTSGYLKYFTLEENITPAGNEVFVQRQYFIEDTAETLLRGYDTDWRPLQSGDSVTSGDRIRVEMTLEAKNNYEYLVLEDYKPAGLEAVELKSGSAYAQKLDRKGKPSGENTWIYQEFRDQKAAFFISKLAEGKHRITYELRAEVPGTFHGMPNQTHAM